MDRLQKNILEAEYALTHKPLLATTVERVLILNRIKNENSELPQSLRFSKALSTLLEEVSTPIEDYDLIAGRTVERELNEEEEKQFRELISQSAYMQKLSFHPSGHCTYSWEAVVLEGLMGLCQKAKAQRERETDTDKRNFLTAIIEIYGAIESYMLRYASAAEANGMTALAKSLRSAAKERPNSLVSALQLLWIITLIDCAYITKNPTLTVGRLDKILYPLYKSDIDRGILTKEQAKEYITDYYCKHNLIMGRGEHQVGDETNSTTFDRICNFDAPQYLLLAGTDEKGELAVNELTELFAECIIPSFKNLVVVVRYVKDMDKTCPSLWRTLTDKALQSSSLMFYNDGNMLKTFMRMGFPDEDARKYIHFGCNWPSPGDNSAWMSGGSSSKWYNAYISDEERKALDIPYMRMNTEHGCPEDFVIILDELAEREPHEVTIEDFYTMFFERMSGFIDRKLANLSQELAVRKRRPSALLTYGDCFYTSSIEHAECISAGAKYHFGLQSFQMFATVADCFIAVDQLVMLEKAYLEATFRCG